MKHQEIRKKLLRYIDAELSPEERVEIKYHLQGCEQCRQIVELLSGAWNLPQPIRRMQPSPFLWNRISAQLAAKTQKKQLAHKAGVLIRQMARPALTTALVALGLFIGIKLGNRLVRPELATSKYSTASRPSEREFGLENFQVFVSGSLGSRLATLMEYNNE